MFREFYARKYLTNPLNFVIISLTKLKQILEASRNKFIVKDILWTISNMAAEGELILQQILNSQIILRII